jgi:hypothetical protein
MGCLSFPYTDQCEMGGEKPSSGAETFRRYKARAISRHYREHPYEFHANGTTMSVGYQPAESNSGAGAL